MDMNESISVNKFYGWSDNRKRKICNEPDRSVVPFKSHSLLCGPTLTWKVFKRQADALDFMRRGGFGLMTFAFQTDETRLFLVAHPDVFWHYDGLVPYLLYYIVLKRGCGRFHEKCILERWIFLLYYIRYIMNMNNLNFRVTYKNQYSTTDTHSRISYKY